jgi:hypothetical protein
MPANSQPRSRSEYAYQQIRDELLDGAGPDCSGSRRVAHRLAGAKLLAAPGARDRQPCILSPWHHCKAEGFVGAVRAVAAAARLQPNVRHSMGALLHNRFQVDTLERVIEES